FADCFGAFTDTPSPAAERTRCGALPAPILDANPGRAPVREEVEMASETRVHVGRIVFGLFVSWLGILFFLDQMGWIDLGNVWRFWPLFLILIGVVQLLSPGRRSVFGALFLMALGGAFLLNEFHVFHFEWQHMWPAFLVIGGLAMMLRGLRWGGTSC